MKPVLWCLSFLRAGPVGLVFVYSYAAHVPRLLRVPAVLSTACSFCRYCVYVRGGNGPKAKADCLPPPHFPHSLSLFSISLRIHNKFYSSGSVVLFSCYVTTITVWKPQAPIQGGFYEPFIHLQNFPHTFPSVRWRSHNSHTFCS